MKKIVVISPRFPYPLEKGDKLRLYYHLKHLSEKFQIILISLSDKKINGQDIEHIEKIVSQVYIFKLSKAGIVFRLLMGIFSKLPFQVLYFFNPSIKSEIEKIISDAKPDFIYNQLIRTAEYTKNLRYFKVLDYMDSFSQGMKKRYITSIFPFSLLFRAEYLRVKRYETSIFDFFDRHIIISEQDKNSFGTEVKKNMTVIPNGVDTIFFQPKSIQKEFDLGFVGNMGYRPNVLASQFIAKQLLPFLKKENKKIRILFAGARPDYRVRILADKNTIVSGWVEDIRDAYGKIRIFVSPIFTGIGQQNKILEAMAMEIPVITTSSVNNAIQATDGKDIMIADNKEEFIFSITKLMNDPILANQTGKAGREFILEKYNWETQKLKLIEIFKN